jgi:hypothetical protein
LASRLACLVLSGRGERFSDLNGLCRGHDRVRRWGGVEQQLDLVVEAAHEEGASSPAVFGGSLSVDRVAVTLGGVHRSVQRAQIGQIRLVGLWCKTVTVGSRCPQRAARTPWGWSADSSTTGACQSIGDSAHLAGRFTERPRSGGLGVQGGW